MLCFLVVFSIFLVLLTCFIRFYKKQEGIKKNKKNEMPKHRNLELEIDDDSLLKYYQRENLFD